MGACCERIEVNEKEKRDDLLSNRKNSILFESFSKQTDYRKK